MITADTLADAAQKAVAAPGSRGSKRETLRLGKINPALKGRFTVKDRDGKSVQVTTVFELMRQKLAPYTLESVAKITGLALGDIRQFAHEFATQIFNVKF